MKQQYRRLQHGEIKQRGDEIANVADLTSWGLASAEVGGPVRDNPGEPDYGYAYRRPITIHQTPTKRRFLRVETA